MRGWPRAAAETAAVYGLLGFLYVAVYAATRPQDLSAPIAAVVPVRKDTFGACCLAASALCAFLLQLDAGPPPIGRPGPGLALRLRQRLRPGLRLRFRRRGALAAALRTCCGYALLVWAYLCTNSITHPATIAQRLTHFTSSPAEGTAGDLCFVLSAAAFLLLRLRGEPAGSGVSRG